MGCNSSKELETATFENSKRKSPTAKAATPESSQQPTQSQPQQKQQRQRNDDDTSAISATIHANKPERLYKLLVKAHTCSNNQQERQLHLRQALEHVQQEPSAASFCNPTTQSTPLHLACRLLDSEVADQSTANAANSIESTLFQIIRTLIAVDREALSRVDAGGHLPLHYAISPSTHFGYSDGSKNASSSSGRPSNEEKKEEAGPGNASLDEQKLQYLFSWKQRAAVVRHLIDSDYATAQDYLSRSNVVYESSDASGPCTPLYRTLQVLPDDMDPHGPTVDYVHVVHHAYPYHAGMGNMSDGDKPLGLLYRRFTRQFDISEKFFAGDNSRPMVVEHRRKYKTAAGNTWKCIELLLTGPATNGLAAASNDGGMMDDGQSLQQQHDPQSGIVHRAAQVETPPDLLRYIVETNAQDLTRVDGTGSLPLHYAAKNMIGVKTSSTSPRSGMQSPRSNNGDTANLRASFPPFYTKYVIDELLYKFPEAASMPDGNGQFPLSLAVEVGKPWIGGGIKSLYDAYPEALQQLDLQSHPTLRTALSMQDGNEEEMEGIALETPKSLAEADAANDNASDVPNGIVKDEDYDAIMLVQSQTVDISEVVMSMWAHEEDAGVQMLGCIAIARMANLCIKNNNLAGIQLLALTSVAAVVNAMKAHPNEMIVQEKACSALQSMSAADGYREISMVASGAVAAMIGAMQAHVGDASVQDHACEAVASIVEKGGPDRATVVASVSGVTAILNALAAHPASEGVQRAGCHALAALINCPGANLPDLPKSQTEPLVRQAQQQFPSSCGPFTTALLQRMNSDDEDDDDDYNNGIDDQSFPSAMPPPSPNAAAI
mmetsp:Transcript_22502/g.63769  ORF Transcript_22502/g.63769 Transcript_22502/m.63769 type:complete len:833 (-) Transcript_22502:38-2536(-)